MMMTTTRTTTKLALHQAILIILLFRCTNVASFQASRLFSTNRAVTFSSYLLSSSKTKTIILSSSDNNVVDTRLVQLLEAKIDDAILCNRDPRPFLRELEAIESIREPNRQEIFKGRWHVWYTDCPPPSNGVLGPFQGTASQVISSQDDGDDTIIISNNNGYQNLLNVAPMDWLTATLDGVWEDWDGVLLSTTLDPQTQSTKTKLDWGANHWKVTFLQLQIKLFGLPLFTKKFDETTSRVWRTTYLQDDVRIVRAGKTGRLEDEVVFYTKRAPAPQPLYDYSSSSNAKTTATSKQ